VSPPVARMAQTEHLPIYKRSYDLCLYLEQIVRGFSRYHKYTLGADLRDGARQVLKLIVRANARRDKAPLLLDVREEVEQLKVVLRLCHDVKALA
jgi:23S rRNA-intervening sequence protein